MMPLVPGVPDHKLVREQLERILSSPRFVRSPTAAGLLKFLVWKALAGEEVKETTIGVDFFGRPADWDTKHDSIVRTTANRVRAGLAEFYGLNGQEALVNIVIPTGSYGAQFSVLERSTAALDTATVMAAVPVIEAARVNGWLWLAVGCAVASIGFAAAFALGTAKGPAQVVTSFPLTRDGREKRFPVFADALNVYFEEDDANGRPALASVPAQGGETSLVSLGPRERVRIIDFSFGRPSFITTQNDAVSQPRFWEWWPRGRSVPLEPTTDDTVRINESTQAYTDDGRLTIRQQGHADRWVPVPGNVNDLSWQPKYALLRFTVYDLEKDTSSIWQMQGVDGKPFRLDRYPKNCFQGRWNQSGEIFTFLTANSGHHGRDIGEIWEADSRAPASIDKPRLTHLTQGPISYLSPMAAPDGRHVYAIGSTEKVELVGYDSSRKIWSPYLGGVNAFETDFSRDGRWVAYVRYPERTLWKVRTDGSERVQLTFEPFEAIQPQWSPDGRQIALMGQWPGGHHRIYLISQSGGRPQELSAEPADQGIPTWSADGSKLVFGELRTQKPQSEMRLHVLEVKSQRQWILPNSAGKWTPRWSPDGRWIAALTANSKELLVYNNAEGSWRSLAEFQNIESPAWSADSQQIYFKTAVRGVHVTNSSFLQRIDVRTGQVALVADLSELEVSDTAWNGLTRDSLPLALRCTRPTDIYSITVPN